MGVKRLVVLVSGRGSNLEAVLQACRLGRIAAQVVGVVCNRPQAGALHIAERYGVASCVVDPKGYPDRQQYDAALARIVAALQPDFIVLAGWMRILSMAFLQHFPDQVINLHPALPGQFPGVNAIERALEAYRDGLITETGCMVHRVPDEGVDAGPTLATRKVPIRTTDTLETLAERMHAAEHELLVETLHSLCQNSREKVAR